MKSLTAGAPGDKPALRLTRERAGNNGPSAWTGLIIHTSGAERLLLAEESGLAVIHLAITGQGFAAPLFAFRLSSSAAMAAHSARASAIARRWAAMASAVSANKRSIFSTDQLAGGRQGDRIMLLGEKNGGPVRWSFLDLRADSFTWRGEPQHGGGRWATGAEFCLSRMASR